MVITYLPRSRAIPEDDTFRGGGFTERTNATCGLPRDEGHHQPRPEALRHEDLGNLDVRRRQTALAKRGGLRGFRLQSFCFSGRDVLDAPVKNLLSDPSTDISIDWATENSTSRWGGGRP